MRVIKRYPNRKLYDKQAKKYITLDSIAELIRSGYDVQVVDHTTGEDLTALTLSQIIFEQEKRQSGFLPRSILTNLIQAGGDRINALQRTVVSPMVLIQHVDEEIKRRIQSLISQGEMLEAEGERLIQKLIPQTSGELRPDTTGDEQIERILQKRSVPTRDEVESIANQLEALANKLDEISQSDR
jgi:polyhydroxyalkanoate synthesis repressor PhaR